jgi:hypothetical protein
VVPSLPNKSSQATNIASLRLCKGFAHFTQTTQHNICACYWRYTL